MSVDEALLLIGHGSARYPHAGSAMLRHAESLRAGGHFGQVEVSVLNGSPPVSEAITAIDKPTIRIVPMFMEEGYFSRVVVPQAIAAAVGSTSHVSAGLPPMVIEDESPTIRVDPEEGPEPGVAGTDRSSRIILCPPIGVHDAMAGVIERQALAACTDLGIHSHTAAVVIIGHGSASEPGQALALHRHASRVASTGLFARVEAACLEELPFVASTFRTLRAHPVIAIGFFANEGGHVRDDVPNLIAMEQTERGDLGFPLRFHGSVIDDPMMVPIVVDQAMAGSRGG
jgi:sirohydrochlorin cobaltochelatase